ncbi:hypothetical protein LWH48_02915 [Halomonas sp. G15]|uniref:FlgO family outer membrane protein n=1 Tax=Halomonas sp. G15 TaxID=2903521 RepID=UPI001E50BB67|nr:FlgO family outer membrane protein [Halomonas sp. G15]MCE0731756.1 hypothetical protein [Halomonas sp. G15]
MRYALCCLALLLSLAGCANHQGALHNAPPPPSLDDALNSSVAEMLETFPALSERNPSVVAASWIDLDAPDITTPFGRLGAELALSSLAQGGITTREVLLEGSNLLVNQDGLSTPRNRTLRQTNIGNDGAILMGTYVQGQETLYVTLRVVVPRNATILASVQLSLPLDEDLQALLRRN